MKKLLLAPALLVAAAFTFKDNKPVPQHKDGIYSIKVYNQILEIEPAVGGRILSLKIDGKDFLTGKSVNADNWGSTFWPSPQSAWGWPPSQELDKKPYKVSIEKNVVKMVSEKDPKLGVVFTKEISGNSKDTSFTIKYTITNQSDKAQKISPWEISRVFPGGITFYPTGKGEKKGDLAKLTEDKNGITWFDYNAVTIPSGVPKLIADGSEGWMAQANNDLLFVKKWPEVPFEKMAPEEGEIELYTNPDKSYIEIEQQGAYEEIAPGKSISWEVKWVLRKLPSKVKAQAGSPELVKFARTLAK